MDWSELMPFDDPIELGSLQALEQEAVRRILVKSKLSSKIFAKTFEELVMAVGFPYRLVAHRFESRELRDIELEMRRHPTQTALILAFEEAAERLADNANRFDLGLCFSWHGHGGLHVLTCENNWPTGMGKCGHFWKIGKTLYLLQPLDSLLEQLGPPTDW